MNQYTAYATHSEVLEFSCAACKTTASARVTASAEGHATSINALAGTPAEVAKRRAEAAAEVEAKRKLKAARCVNCGERDPGAARRWWLLRLSVPVGVVVICVVAAYFPTIAGNEIDADTQATLVKIVGGIGLFVGAVAFLFHCWLPWRSIDDGIDWLGKQQPR